MNGCTRLIFFLGKEVQEGRMCVYHHGPVLPCFALHTAHAPCDAIAQGGIIITIILNNESLIMSRPLL